MSSPTSLVSVLLLTRDEASNVEAAIRSFPPGTPIVVLDSQSTDGTVEIARRLGASVVQRRFDSWSSHQNWAVKNITFGTEWVYYGDADERMTSTLWDEVCVAVRDPRKYAAFEVRRRDMFLGRWLKHSSFSSWFVRLFRPSAIRWERLVNPVPVVSGGVGRLEGHFIHYPFSKGTMQWFQRHVRYAEMEADELVTETSDPISWSLLTSRDHRVRRRTIKALYYRAPLRPLLRFVTLYFLKGGFMDGHAGLYYAAMQSAYELMVQMRVLELRRKAAREHV